MMRPETVLVGDVKVVVVPGDGADAVETALGQADPGTTVVVAASAPEQTMQDLARFGGVVVEEDGEVRRPSEVDRTRDDGHHEIDIRSAGVEIGR
jgi:hypothetical protein